MGEQLSARQRASQMGCGFRVDGRPGGPYYVSRLVLELGGVPEECAHEHGSMRVADRCGLERLAAARGEVPGWRVRARGTGAVRAVHAACLEDMRRDGLIRSRGLVGFEVDNVDTLPGGAPCMRRDACRVALEAVAA